MSGNPDPQIAEVEACLPATQVTESRFHELDILRGVAAFTVVVFHYKHFLLDDTGNFDYAHMPFYGLLAPVFVFGQYFVELFFSISGYVFFWLYGQAVAERRVGLGDFFIARFSRLYPLYVVTFLFVALGQWVYTALHGHSYIYTHNGLFDAVLNLLMVQEWRPNAELSFNGPSWSISVEMFLYSTFFTVCAFRFNRPWTMIGIVVLGLAFEYLQPQPAANFARGIPNFFLGGLIFYLVQYLREAGREALRQRFETVLLWAVPILWLATYVRTHPILVPVADWMEAHGLGSQSPLFSRDSFVNVLTPLTLLLIALRQGRWLSAERLQRWSWIGDISYSIYLIHFPLQLAVMMLLAGLPYATRAEVFASPVVFVAFLAAVIGLARFSFKHFEMPMRRYLKAWMGRRLVSSKRFGTANERE